MSGRITRIKRREQGDACAGRRRAGRSGAATLSIPGAVFPIMPTATGFAIMLALLALCGTVTGPVTATAPAVLIPIEIRAFASARSWWRTR